MCYTNHIYINWVIFILDNYELLLSKNPGFSSKRIFLEKGCIIYRYRESIFGGLAIKDMLNAIRSVKKEYGNLKVPFQIDLGNVIFKDKLTYIFLEILCDLLIRKYQHPVRVIFKCKPDILTEGISISPLRVLDGNKEHLKDFLKIFNDEIYKNHYRKIVKGDTKSNHLSKLMDEVNAFLTFSGIERSCAGEIAEVIVELVGNAWEHAASDCLIDMDVTGSYFANNSDNTYLGINIAVVNFSTTLFSQALEKKIVNNPVVEELGERYQEVKQAYDFHKKHFDDSYRQNDFFNIASYQHKISGRNEKLYTGGTGLTKLISSLEQRSYMHMCYMISGDRALWFNKDHLEYNDEGWIGFNNEKDFLHAVPSRETFTKNGIYMPGTAYNLNFIMERGPQYGE